MLFLLKIIFMSMFEYFIENEFFTVCQSDFLPGDYCTSQLLSIIDVRGVFLDTSKAFDKIWHKVVVCKRKSYRISSNLLKLIDRKQRVLINGQTFPWRRFLSGVLQRLVLGPLLFLIYINNFPDRIQSICKVFVF